MAFPSSDAWVLGPGCCGLLTCVQPAGQFLNLPLLLRELRLQLGDIGWCSLLGPGMSIPQSQVGRHSMRAKLRIVMFFNFCDLVRILRILAQSTCDCSSVLIDNSG